MATMIAGEGCATGGRIIQVGFLAKLLLGRFLFAILIATLIATGRLAPIVQIKPPSIA